MFVIYNLIPLLSKEILLLQVLEICQAQSCGNRQKQLAIAKFDFEAEYPAELSFQKVGETGVLLEIKLTLNILFLILSNSLFLIIHLFTGYE